MKPSEYLDRNCFFAASTPGEDDIDRRHLIGIGNLMWGNDLPHPEGTFPYTRYWIRERFQRRPRGRDPPDPRAHRRRGLRRRPRRRSQPLVDRIGPTLDEVHGDAHIERVPGRTSEPRSATMSISEHRARDLHRLPDAAGSPGARRPRPATHRAQPHAPSPASRSPSPTAGSSSPRRRDLDARRDADVPGTSARTSCCTGATTGTRTWSTRSARTSAPTSAVGGTRRGRLHPLPVPRLALRRRHRPVQRDPLRQHGSHPEPGPRPRRTRASSATG